MMLEDATVSTDARLPGVRIITSKHGEKGRDRPILHSRVELARVAVGSGADLGIGTILLPGASVGEGAQLGSGSVVTHDVPAYEAWAGVPVRKLRARPV